MWNVFEYPFVGIGVAIVALVGVWIYEAVRPLKRRKWHLLVPAGIVVLSFAVCYFVQTDKEKILGVINKGIKAFEEQKIEPIREIIADDYSDRAHGSKKLILAYCEALFQTAMVERVTFLSRETVIEKNTATFTTEAFLKFAERSEIAKMGKTFLIVKMRFYFKKTADGKWLINGSEILELDRKSVSWNDIAGA